MADYSTQEISNLKDTLCAQQHLLQKLYNELDAEREASATAASEALSVILRLQGEKAAVKMEAEQYKRLAEEKMCHAEESFAIIEDIIYQKEMEVAALDYQAQAYRYKLLSMGCADLGGGEIKFPEKLLQRSHSLTGDSSLGRRNSTSVLLKYKKGMVDRESSLSPKMDLVSKNVEDQIGPEINDLGSDMERKAGGSTHGGVIMSYGDEIRKLEIRVKEIAGANYSSRNEMRSPNSSISSRLSAGNLSYLSISGNIQPEARSPSPHISNGNNLKVASVNESDHVKNSRTLNKGEAVSYPCSPSVLDVFEVPQVDQCESLPNNQRKKDSEDLIHPEAVKLSGKDEPDWLRKLFQSTRNENSLCKPSYIAGIDCAVVQPTTSAGESRSRLNLSNESEIERIGESNSREEELKLLKEIKEKLNLLHDEIRSEKGTKPSVREKLPQCPLSEAMLHFWL